MITQRAAATAAGIRLVAGAIADGGDKAVALRVAEQYLSAFGNIAKASTTVLLPSNAGDPASAIASAMTMYKQLVAATADGKAAAAGGEEGGLVAAAAAARGRGGGARGPAGPTSGKTGHGEGGSLTGFSLQS